jgi:hypothetical protein
MPVQAAAGPVIPDRGARVSVRGGFLHVTQWDPGIKRGGDERVSERVGRDGLADPGAAGGLADDPPGAVPVKPPPVGGREHRPADAFADGQVDRPGRARRQRDGDDLAALAGDRQGPVAPFQGQVLDVGTGGLGDPQSVVSSQVPGQGKPFGIGEGRLDRDERGGWGGSGHRAPPGRAETREAGPAAGPQRLRGT